MELALSAVGNIIAALALVAAVVQLVRLRDERQRNFYLTQLVGLSDALDDFGSAAPDKVQVRVHLLPREMVPTAWAWVTEGDRPPSPLFATFEEDRVEGEDWSDWVRTRVRAEINEAVNLQLTTRGGQLRRLRAWRSRT